MTQKHDPDSTAVRARLTQSIEAVGFDHITLRSTTLPQDPEHGHHRSICRVSSQRVLKKPLVLNVLAALSQEGGYPLRTKGIKEDTTVHLRQVISARNPSQISQADTIQKISPFSSPETATTTLQPNQKSSHNFNRT